MYEPVSRRDRALDQLSSEFPTVPVRVVIAVFLGYLDRERSLDQVLRASRQRIRDACAVPAPPGVCLTPS